jgi:hypothetical protein
MESFLCQGDVLQHMSLYAQDLCAKEEL